MFVPFVLFAANHFSVFVLFVAKFIDIPRPLC